MPEDELSALVLRACLIARDAVFNVRDSLANGSRLAVLAIKDCEKELDQIERKIDEQLPGAITRVGEAKARELLACLKFITDLERIGDLAYSAIMQLESRREKLPAADSRQLVENGFPALRNAGAGASGLSDARPRHTRRAFCNRTRRWTACATRFFRGIWPTDASASAQNFDILLAAQALERIGDHAKNLAEEVYGLAEGRSLRHNTRKLAYS